MGVATADRSAWHDQEVIVVIAVAIVVVVGLAAALALGLLGGMSVQAPAPTSSAGGHPLADSPVTSDSLAGVRFDRAVRGYRMDQVDAVMDRLYERLAELEGDDGVSVRRFSGDWYDTPGETAFDTDGHGRTSADPSGSSRPPAGS